MKQLFFSASMVLLMSILSLSNALGQEDKPSFENRKSLTIVITDSGLGGLDVMDDISKKIATTGNYKKVNLIFVNALFEAGTGYNSLQSREEKIKVFNGVLYGIERNYHPDIILIACNTLSVIYAETNFIQSSKVPVMGIVKSGVDLIISNLEKETNSSVIITGTETTISENKHAKSLIEKGIPSDQIVTQACPQLQSYIEQDPGGEDTGMLISIYVDEAISKLSANHGPVYLSLNCSHFGYAENLWKEAFEFSGLELAGIINPNDIMGDFLMPETGRNRYSKTKVHLSVASKVEILNKESIMGLFKDQSPELANALNNYDIVNGLF